MRKLFTFMGLLGVVAFLAACSTGPSYTFTINGELIAVEPPPAEETEADAATDETDETSDAAGEEVEEPVDWSTATVSVTHEVEGENGETETAVLASTDLVDGKFEVTGEIEKATEVTITASVGEEELAATALLVPNGAAISMVLVDDMNEYPRDSLYVLGESRQSQDPSQKFSISGDLSDLEKDVSMYEFGAFGRILKDGEMVSASLGSVMLKDGKFLLEADAAGAQIVSVYLSSPYTQDFSEYVYASTQIIAEPNANFEVKLHATDVLSVTSGGGKHAELIESWEQSDEYQSKFDAYEASYVAYMAEQEAKREAAKQEAEAAAASEEVPGTEAEAVQETETETDTETDTAIVEETEEESSAPQVAGMEPAEGCEHVVIDQTHRPMSAMFASDEPSDDDPEYVVLRRELTQIREAATQNFLNDWDNPINVLLTMELGAIPSYDENREDAFPIYDKLAELLDPEIVAQRVTPARDRLVAVIEREENDSTLLQGQKVPEFTLANAEGEDVVLYDVLAERQVTLIDFWASWCGPCIASFPELKRLYAAYKDHGFEIIGVSIDDNYEDWNNAAIEQELPWIDVGELKDWEGPVAVSYGVGFIPKAFLVDPNGCVLKKNVRTDMLEEALVQRFGETPEVEADAAETDSDTVDSGTDEMGG
ncbi:MAG: TlpA family protein disulfide reductase [Gammaproteobacteria bacterium]|nr:TlpA family protein disulfide reductase [Gammaproteobacteria bacterium]MYD79928.1 TlpA family protein disulfide reductase [Gammaproteobacteria bacterium]